MIYNDFTILNQIESNIVRFLDDRLPECEIQFEWVHDEMQSISIWD